MIGIVLLDHSLFFFFLLSIFYFPISITNFPQSYVGDLLDFLLSPWMIFQTQPEPFVLIRKNEMRAAGRLASLPAPICSPHPPFCSSAFVLPRYPCRVSSISFRKTFFF